MINIKGLLSNPMAALQSSRQPGGLLAPVTSFREGITDPRLFLAEALINRTPITEAIGNYAAVNKALTPEDKERKIVKGADGRQRYVDTRELVFPDVEPTPEKLSEREIRIDDLMTTFNIDRASALKFDKGLIKLGTDEKGVPVLIDSVSNTQTPVGQTISQELNSSTAISSEGENLIKNQIPNFMVTAPDIIEKAYSDSSKDDAILLAGATEIGIESAAQIAKILEQKPDIAGVLGSIQRGGKTLFGTVSDLQSGVDLNLFPPQVLNMFQDPDISRIAILEERVVNAMADTAAKKGGRTPTTALRAEQRDKLNLTGFTDSASVITRLQEIAKELNKDSMQFQGVKGGYNTEIFGDRVKDYSLDPTYGALFQPTRIRLNASDYTD